jgi:hypothetical protein
MVVVESVPVRRGFLGGEFNRLLAASRGDMESLSVSV